jgi:hypothetical protein
VSTGQSSEGTWFLAAKSIRWAVARDGEPLVPRIPKQFVESSPRKYIAILIDNPSVDDVVLNRLRENSLHAPPILNSVVETHSSEGVEVAVPAAH